MNINTYVSMLAFLYTYDYALGFGTEIMINSGLWNWNFILDGLKNIMILP